jgi:serine phosphatase RsbU (regulator of sigma subunit)
VLGNKVSMALCYENIGMTMYAEGDYDRAANYFLSALEIVRSSGNVSSLIDVLNNTALIYDKSENYDKAIKYYEEAVTLSTQTGALDGLKNAYIGLSYIFEKNKDFEKSLSYHKEYSELKDSIFNLEKNKQFEEIQAQFETEKKQKEIELKESQLARSEIEIRQQKTQKFAMFVGFALMVVLSVVIFKSYKDKKKANVLLSSQKFEIEKKNLELNNRNLEISAQKNEIENQKKHIENIHQEVTSSIIYAKSIQKAVMPNENRFYEKVLHDFFILYKPKDIVSGDFYFAERRDDMLFIAVADSTGHGVPGAFMSMLGVSFLNEIVRKKEITTAAEVLNYLRGSVIDALQQKGESGEQKDGMDISLIVINKFVDETISQLKDSNKNNFQVGTLNNQQIYHAQWAGANNPLWIVKTQKLESVKLTVESNTEDDNLNYMKVELYELKGDKMPVAIYENMQPFTNHVIDLHKGDIIYLLSDGYEDQFGGPKGKKFLSYNLKQLLLDKYQKTMSDQKSILDSTLAIWIGEGEQIDDITILGIKI